MGLRAVVERGLLCGVLAVEVGVDVVVAVGVEREPAERGDLEVAAGPVGGPDAVVLDGEVHRDADLGPVGLDDRHVLLAHKKRPPALRGRSLCCSR